MAERRMFSKTIIDSDSFIDMPLSTQALYFHLSMRADDDGFVNNPKKIMKMINASEDDYKMLCTENFVIPFESGVVVIKHWKIHNYIQKDRYRPTVYIDEKKALIEEKNGLYTKCIQVVSKMDTQVRIDKDRDSIELGEDRTVEDCTASLTENTYTTVINLFHKICVSFPKLTAITEERKKAIIALLNKYSLENIEEAFILAESSDFLKGANGKWNASFDWLMNESNFVKVLEGNYNNKIPNTPVQQKETEYDRFMSGLSKFVEENEK